MIFKFKNYKLLRNYTISQFDTNDWRIPNIDPSVRTFVEERTSDRKLCENIVRQAAKNNVHDVLQLLSRDGTKYQPYFMALVMGPK